MKICDVIKNFTYTRLPENCPALQINKFLIMYSINFKSLRYERHLKSFICHPMWFVQHSLTIIEVKSYLHNLITYREGIMELASLALQLRKEIFAERHIRPQSFLYNSILKLNRN